MRFTRKWRTARTGEEYPSLGPGHPSRARGRLSALGQGDRPPEKGYPAMGNSRSVPRLRGTRSPDNGIIVHRKKLTSVAKGVTLPSIKGIYPALGKSGTRPRKRGPRASEKEYSSLRKGYPTPGKGQNGLRQKGVSDTRKRLIPPSYKGSPVPREMCPRPSEYRWPVVRNEGTSVPR